MRAGRKFVKPLYTVDEAYVALKNFVVRGFDEEFDVIPGIKAKFKVAGHIAGSAIAEIFAEEDGQKTKLFLPAMSVSPVRRFWKTLNSFRAPILS